MKIEIYKLANRLKSRMGARFQKQQTGFLAEDAIEEANKLITALCAICPEVTGKHLDNLTTLWSDMKDMPASQERTDTAQKIFTLAHEIKDMSGLCGFELLAYFSESLRDYIGRTDLNLKAQVVIIQAHIDAMLIVHKQGVKKDAGPQADELKKMVKMAIDKYH